MGNLCCFYVARETAGYKAKSEYQKISGNDEQTDAWNGALTAAVNKTQSLVYDGQHKYKKQKANRALSKNRKQSEEMRNKYFGENSADFGKPSSRSSSVSSTKSLDSYNSLRDSYKKQYN